MNRTIFGLIILFLIACNSAGDRIGNYSPPVAKKIPKTFSEHGHTRVDPYYWLNDPKDSAVISLLNEENEYESKMMAHTSALQEKIYGELVGRIEQKYVSLPYKQNGYWNYIRFEEGNQYPLYCRRKETQEAPEQVVLDGNELAEGHQIFLIRGRSFSRDNNWLAYGVDTTGGRVCTVYFKNLNTQVLSPETIPNADGSYAWSGDNKSFYYVELDNTVRSYRVMKHILGTEPSGDVEIYSEPDSTFSVDIYSSTDNRYIFINSSSTTTSECRYLDGNNPAAAPVLIQPRIRDLLYTPDYREGNIFHIYTNKDAKNFKLVSTPIGTPGMDHWTDVIPHRDSALLEGYEILRNFIVTEHMYKGLPEITILNRSDNHSSKVDFGEDCYVASMSTATDEYDLDSIRYDYESLTTPRSDFEYNLRNGEKKLLKQQKVGGGYDASDYEAHRLWARATDGTSIPVSIVYQKGKMKKDGMAPLLLYAYGSYGYSTEPYFNSSVISLLDRGVAFAIAHVRGGQEMGRYWYDDGKLLKKKNTFSDFVDCAQYLVNEKYTSPDRLFANGGSAGGMLMGAIINMRPDLFRGVIAEVPWMDVITDMFNPDLPLTTLEYDEWGDPGKSEYYDYMLSWSPYDNVQKADYPAILATGGLNDTQVPYFSPAKWVQKVREMNTGTNPVLFKCNMGAGHGGESGRYERQKLTALKYAFILDLSGIKK